ncbi:hypothetical protein B0H11DRAFT_1993388 [Mycena galericulata]|nr:hypothetical protein B0H11DRAFT_1993388 [Mycena galericulata]
MSIILPIQALATMQVSLKIGSDGQFALEMGQASDADVPHAQLDGLKLHLHSVPDLRGVRLTLFVSIEAEHGNRDLDSCLEPSLTQPPLDFSAGAQPFDFSSHLYPGTVGNSDYVLDSFQAGERKPGSFESPNTFNAFQLYEDLSQALDTDHVQLCHSNITGADLNSAFEPHDYNTHDVAASDSTSPDASTSSSECDADYPEPLSSTSGSPGLSTRGPPRPSNFPCPKASCSRTFPSQYALSMHVQKHIVKPTSFPCSGCALEFSRRHDRLRHEVSQHGCVREWECKLCLGFFSSQKTLQKHKCKARRTGR